MIERESAVGGGPRSHISEAKCVFNALASLACPNRIVPPLPIFLNFCQYRKVPQKDFGQTSLQENLGNEPDHDVVWPVVLFLAFTKN